MQSIKPEACYTLIKNHTVQIVFQFPIMKKIFFFLLLLPATLIGQKNWHVDSLYKHIHLDTIGICISKRNTIALLNEEWINIQWLNKIGIIIYPNIEDLYKWDRECTQAMKGITISY
jgi:hypothetical protein